MKHTTAVLLIGGLLLSACQNRRRSETAAPGGSVATSSGCTESNGIGRLKLLLTTEPTVSDTSEALVRLQGETERSTVRVNAVLGTTFELRPGSYRLSISLAGYKGAERAVSIDCGVERTLTVPLSSKR